MASKYAISTIFKGIDRVTKPVRKMGKSVKSFSLSAEKNLRKVDRVTGKLSANLLKIGKNAAIGAAGIASLAVVGASAVNAQALATENMSKAMGANIQTVETVSGAIQGIGLDAEAVTDLFEEMNNKFGESSGLKELAPVTESLAILGLEFEKIKKLSPDQQFRAITDAALKLESATQAQAAADILMGAEANKIIGTLRQQGKSFADIENAHKMLTFRTERSRQGARDHAIEQAKAGKIIASLGMEISGLIGLHLTPLIKKFNEFAIKNKELISQSVDKFFAKVGNSIGDVSAILERTLTWFNKLDLDFQNAKEWAVIIFEVTAAIVIMSGVIKAAVIVTTALNLAMLAFEAIPAVIASVRAIMLTLNAAMLANPIGALALAFGLAASAIILNWEPISAFFSDMFDGISDKYNKTVGQISAKITALGRMLGIVDDEVETEMKATITTNNTVTPQERITRQLVEKREDFNINVRADQGSFAYADYKTPRLNLINSGN